MKRWLWTIVALLLVGGGFWATYRFAFGERQKVDLTKLPTALARKGRFEVTLSGVGEIQTAKETTISSRFGGKIVYLADEGFVKEGDLLVEFDTTQLQDQLRDLRLSYQLAQDNLANKKRSMDLELLQLKNALESAQNDLDIAQANLEEKQKDHERTRKLVERGLYPQVQLEQASLALLQTQKNHEKIQRSFEETKNRMETRQRVLETEYRSSQADLDKKKRDMEEVEKKISQAKILAPTSGLVVYAMSWRAGSMTKVQKGDDSWPNQAIMTFPDMSEILSVLKVEEGNISQVVAGQTARVTVESFPDQPYEGTVAKKGIVAITQLQRQRFWFSTGQESKGFEVQIRLEAKDDRLRPGMTTRNEIILEEVADTVHIPLESLFEKDGNVVVYIKESHTEYRAVPVTLGKRTATEAQVLEGLNGTETVFLADPTRESARAALPERKSTIGSSGPAGGSPGPGPRGGRPSGAPPGGGPRRGGPP
jgi:multidrug efflux pump subunit AcrA (membrane-fusion protein)